MFLLTSHFYKSVLEQCLKKGKFTQNDHILVVAGGNRDKAVFEELGFKNVTISNLDERMIADQFAPYKWSFQDAESLTFKDNTFDVCIVHHGLHHCHSPHFALLELYRVAKKGVLCFEPIDNKMTALGLSLGFSESHELTAVFDHGFQYGGYRNGPIPNFVYRWTEKEIKKTINSNDPKANAFVKFFYGLELPFSRFKRLKNKLFYLIALLSYPFIGFVFMLFHKQIGNRFGFWVHKPVEKEYFPWLKVEKDQVVPDQDYFKKKFKVKSKK